MQRRPLSAEREIHVRFNPMLSYKGNKTYNYNNTQCEVCTWKATQTSRSIWDVDASDTYCQKIGVAVTAPKQYIPGRAGPYHPRQATQSFQYSLRKAKHFLPIPQLFHAISLPCSAAEFRTESLTVPMSSGAKKNGKQHYKEQTTHVKQHKLHKNVGKPTRTYTHIFSKPETHKTVMQWKNC